MSKKQKQCQGRDTFHRMNYLQQASKLMAGRNDFLSSYFGTQCKAIGKKSVLKMEPAVKRSLCKKCSIFLKPGETADIDVKETPQKVSIISCRRCGFRKRYHINSKYSMWLDNPDSVAEALNFAPETNTCQTKGQQSPTENGRIVPREKNFPEKYLKRGGNCIDPSAVIRSNNEDTGKQEANS
ncbi:uncharacterized protein LOC132257901 [Phlebotomus argentipes]|uniref:uncharacterized protein LOC132257901 n=1 Tax=Phlebotomus argentipes TaxID=94469 RepID=UPI00289342D4|nr:uncharacterized protein LOC132257901 [Phlebotomus argentipes]